MRAGIFWLSTLAALTAGVAVPAIAASDAWGPQVGPVAAVPQSEVGAPSKCGPLPATRGPEPGAWQCVSSETVAPAPPRGGGPAEPAHAKITWTWTWVRDTDKAKVVCGKGACAPAS